MKELRAADLLSFEVPEARQRLTPFQCALYAISIGFARDPMEARERTFVDPDPDMPVVPSMALVMGYPGFWLGLPATGVDATRVIHADQSITLHQSLPSSGEIVGTTRVTGIGSRGEGKGLAMTSERDIRDDSGAPIATVAQTHFLLGNSAKIEDAPRAYDNGPPDTAPDHEVVFETRADQALLYRLNGDLNPLHSDPEVAARAGFERPILHGMSTFGVATRAILAACLDYDCARLRRISMQFRAPVYPGETLVTELWSEGWFRVRVVDRDVVVADRGRFELGDLPGSATP
ncbi:MaoC/PaaZ C-terminal domain-containing protein [Oceanicola sp. 502str15]|uniref:MaoC/PaaZ C-terminal domain-containing protein n=1 Tax=Oceanicola sp. 502str15 TaxID=2696061 RepID=UPI002095A396|nr:MaoC/PaaZ C-terminal domain-containing protein [Oceanicola sp. 502str15]MCO6385326.1 3-alpha,7-alpha,12-alpha-trihydroxy-5-beta-cholest-24-enoyl-CoA hydratase [Oceanicola sp. 502str15]